MPRARVVPGKNQGHESARRAKAHGQTQGFLGAALSQDQTQSLEQRYNECPLVAARRPGAEGDVLSLGENGETGAEAGAQLNAQASFPRGTATGRL